MSSLLAPVHGGATRVNCFPSPLTRNYIQLRALAFHGAPVVAFRRVTPQLRSVSTTPSHRRSVTCLFGEKGEPIENKDKDASLWKSLENTMGNFRKRSIDDILREQIREQESTGGGGSGGPPKGGGGGGDGSGETEDEGFVGIIDELLQVFFAALGFFFLYKYLIYGEDMSRLAKDYIIYLFTTRTSVRLRRAMRKWVTPWKVLKRRTTRKIKRKIRQITRMIKGKITGKTKKKISRKKMLRRDWLKRAILATRTKWWKLQRRRMMRGYV